MPVILKVGIDPVHFGVDDDAQSDDRAAAPPHGMVLFVLSRIAGLSIRTNHHSATAMAPPLLMSLVAITMIPEPTLWRPRIAGMVN